MMRRQLGDDDDDDHHHHLDVEYNRRHWYILGRLLHDSHIESC